VQNNRSSRSKKEYFLYVLLIGIGLFQQACVSQINVPVQEGRFATPETKQSHVVRKGETLYSIAWYLNKDYKELAQSNRITKPYTIYPGQVLYWGRAVKKTSPKRVKPNRKAKPKVVRIAGKSPAHSRPKKSLSKRPALPKATPKSGLNWRWPYDGAIISGFSRNGIGNRGLDISGKAGDSVKAAANGEVVYSGSGLVGYGNLIIIKHNEIFLSAYAHNRRLFVKEGESVKAGQKIAEIGSSGTNLEKLHFEIRREGTPVDPLQLLPQRG